MRKLLAAVITLIIVAPLHAQDAEAIRLSEPVQVDENHEVYGAKVEEWKEAKSLTSVVQEAEKLTGEVLTIETKVAQVCQKKGCFFIASEDNYTARITFKDYGFFIPTDSQGKKVKLIGTLEIRELTEEQAKHYTEDTGNNPDLITGPQREYSIVATSVLIPKS